MIGSGHPLHALLSRVLSDEERHVRQCSHMLQRLVAPREVPQLRAMLAEIRAIERSYGVAGAIGMWVAGLTLRLRPGAAPVPA